MSDLPNDLHRFIRPANRHEAEEQPTAEQEEQLAAYIAARRDELWQARSHREDGVAAVETADVPVSVRNGKFIFGA